MAPHPGAFSKGLNDDVTIFSLDRVMGFRPSKRALELPPAGSKGLLIGARHSSPIPGRSNTRTNWSTTSPKAASPRDQWRGNNQKTP